MGLLCDFFSASPERARSIDPEHWLEVVDEFEVLESGGIEPTVMFSFLEQILVGTPWEDALEVEVRLSGSGECWM